jgi:phenylacetate-CoA ligase
VLQGMPGVRGHYIEAHGEFALSDRIRVVVGSSDPSLSGEAVAERIAAAIRVRPEVEIVTPEEVATMTTRADKRKPVTFFDHRSA